MSKLTKKHKSGVNPSEIVWSTIYALTVLVRFITLQTFLANRREGREPVIITDLDSCQIEKLNEAGIAFTTNGAKKNSDQRCNITVENRRLNATLHALDLSELYRINGEDGPEIITIDREEALADSRRLTIVGLVSASDSARNKIRLFNKKNRKASHTLVLAETQKALARIIAARLRPIFQCKITVHIDGPVNKNLSKLASDTLHVFITTLAIDTPAELCGIAVNARNISSYKHKLRGVLITDPSNHSVIGEYHANYHNYLYFFAGLDTAKSESDSLRLFDRFAQETVEQIDVGRLADSVGKWLRAVDSAQNFSNKDIAHNRALTANQVQVSGISERPGRLMAQLTADLLGPMLGSDSEGKEILIIDGADEAQQPVADGKFRIFSDAYRLSSATVASPTHFWGWPVPKGEYAYKPSGNGRIIADENGFPIAELIGDNLYILLTLVREGSRLEALLFARFLHEVRSLIKMQGQDALSTHDQNMFMAQAQHLLQKTAADVKAADDDLARLNEKVRASGDALSKELTMARYTERGFYQLYDTLDLELGAEFDHMLNVRKVLDVKVTDTSMTATTDLIYCVDTRTGKTHELGAFEITFPFNSTKAIRWRNLTRRVEGFRTNYNAPHVNANGLACLGNVQDVFPKLLANREYSTALQLAIAFLESVDTKDSWGQYIHKWPVVYGVS